MKTILFVILILVPWLLIAPWIAKGYGEWHWPNPLADHSGAMVDAAFFYLPPIFLAAFLASKLLGKSNAPNN